MKRTMMIVSVMATLLVAGCVGDGKSTGLSGVFAPKYQVSYSLCVCNPILRPKVTICGPQEDLEDLLVVSTDPTGRALGYDIFEHVKPGTVVAYPGVGFDVPGRYALEVKVKGKSVWREEFELSPPDLKIEGMTGEFTPAKQPGIFKLSRAKLFLRNGQGTPVPVGISRASICIGGKDLNIGFVDGVPYVVGTREERNVVISDSYGRDLPVFRAGETVKATIVLNEGYQNRVQYEQSFTVGPAKEVAKTPPVNGDLAMSR